MSRLSLQCFERTTTIVAKHSWVWLVKWAVADGWVPVRRFPSNAGFLKQTRENHIAYEVFRTCNSGHVFIISNFLGTDTTTNCPTQEMCFIHKEIGWISFIFWSHSFETQIPNRANHESDMWPRSHTLSHLEWKLPQLAKLMQLWHTNIIMWGCFVKGSFIIYLTEKQVKWKKCFFDVNKTR